MESATLRSASPEAAVPAAAPAPLSGPGPLGWTPSDFLRSRFIPAVVYVRETEDFHTRLCVYNYFSEMFPEVKTGATVNIWVFDDMGSPVASFEEHLGFKGQIQFELARVGRHFEGTAALSMVPDTLPEIKHPWNVGTGYYVYYYDRAGHADFSHEWDTMNFKPSRTTPWICLVRPRIFPDLQLLFMAGYYGDDPASAPCRFKAILRNGRGKVLAECPMTLPPRGTRRLPIEAVFPDLLKHADREDALAVEVTGENLHGPFTWVTHKGGDFNLHHFP